MRKTETVNEARGGVSHAIKANYWKMSTANFWHKDGRIATGVIEYEDSETNKPNAGRDGKDA